MSAPPERAAVIPAQLVRALGTACRLAGLAEAHADACALEERATHSDVVALLDELICAVDAQQPARAPSEPRRLPRRPTTIAELAAAGRSDPEIAAELGTTTDAIRSARRRYGIAAGAPDARIRSGWEERLREAHGRGLTTPELAVELGWTVRTVEVRRSRLGLRENKR